MIYDLRFMISSGGSVVSMVLPLGVGDADLAGRVGNTNDAVLFAVAKRLKYRHADVTGSADWHS